MALVIGVRGVWVMVRVGVALGVPVTARVGVALGAAVMVRVGVALGVAVMVRVTVVPGAPTMDRAMRPRKVAGSDQAKASLGMPVRARDIEAQA